MVCVLKNAMLNADYYYELNVDGEAHFSNNKMESNFLQIHDAKKEFSENGKLSTKKELELVLQELKSSTSKEIEKYDWDVQLNCCAISFPRTFCEDISENFQ